MRSSFVIVSWLLLLVPFVTTLQGGRPVTVAPDAQALATAYNSESKVVSGPGGDLYSVYTVNLPNGSYVVEVSKSTDGGGTWAPLAPTPSSANSSRGALAIDTKGDIHLVWTEGIPGASQIYYSVFDGSSWSAKAKLSNSPWYSGYPSIAVDSTGGLHVLWYGYDGEFYQIFYSANNGTGWSAPVNISKLSEDSVNPAILRGLGGRLYAVWYALVGRHYQIWFATRDGSWSVASQVTSDAQDALNPSVAVGPTGRLDVVWDEEVQGVTQIFHMSYDGLKWSKETQLTSLQYDSINPTIAFSEGGEPYLFWTSSGVLYGCTYESTCSPSVVYSNGVNNYPSVAAAPAYSGALNLIWTNQADGRTSVLYEQIPAGQGAQGGGAGFLLLLTLTVVTAVYLLAWARVTASRGRGASGAPVR